MVTRLYTHDACFDHEMGSGHPERPARLRAVREALDAPAFAALDRAEAPRAARDRLTLAHPPRYVDRVLASVPEHGTVPLDADTALSPGSGEAALRAAGAVCAAVDDVAGGAAANAFCAVRPPGHHAEPETAMGFCFFGNAAIAALHARERHGLERVAVVDFDVHHGNGTQAIVWDNPDVMLLSTHQMPLFPGTGASDERGAHDQIVNAPLAGGSGGDAFRTAWATTLLPRLRAFAPALIVISAGFDAHADDPLAGLRLGEADFAWLTREVTAIARDVCRGRVVSTLEGGYDLPSLGAGAAAHVAALMDAG